jgi:hypothetical protein
MTKNTERIAVRCGFLSCYVGGFYMAMIKNPDESLISHIFSGLFGALVILIITVQAAMALEILDNSYEGTVDKQSLPLFQGCGWIVVLFGLSWIMSSF